MADKATVKRLLQAVKEKSDYLIQLQHDEPQEFLKLKDSIMEEIRLLKLSLFRITVEDYPKQNPVKWVGKKDRLLAKLAFLEAGGLEENFVYVPAPKVPVVPVQAPAIPEEKFICEVCKFEAKSKAGLAKHATSHKEKVNA